MNDPQKNDFVYFRNEILKDMKQIETKINDKVLNFCSYINKFTEETDKKLESINSKIKIIQENDPILLEKKIYAKIEKNKNDYSEKLSDMGTKIFILQRDFTNACYKYDKIVIDNLKVTGIIGEGCPYVNLRYYIEYINKKLGELQAAKDKLFNEIKIIKGFQNNILSNVKLELDNQKNFVSDMTSKRLTEEEKKCLERSKKLEEGLDNIKLENYNFSNNLIKKTEEIQIQWDKLENIKEEIYQKLNEEKINFRRFTDNLANTFNSNKKEFNLIKSRFTDLSNFFKHFPMMKFPSSDGNNNIDRKEIIKMTKRMNFTKKQSLNKEDLELIENESNKNNEENENINEDDNRNHEILLTNNLKKEDSNLIDNNNIKENLENNFENESKIKINNDNNENEKEVDLENIKIAKNIRKNNTNTNNLNNEDKNIYTKISVKSINKKSIDYNSHYIDKKRRNDKKEIPIDILIKNEGKDNFSQTSKNIFFDMKKKNSPKKISFNNSNEKKENVNISLPKDDIRKKLLKNENEKIHEYLSFSNEVKTFNRYTNTTPLNLKYKKMLNRKDSKKYEEIPPLLLDNSFSKTNLNNDSEKQIFNKIIQYINMTNQNINNKFKNISDKMGNDIFSIKKEINQIYNDVSLISLNSNKNIKKKIPFRMKINNYDLYNCSGIQLNMENFRKMYKKTFYKNKSNDKNFNSENKESPRNILNSIEPYLVKKFKEKEKFS